MFMSELTLTRKRKMNYVANKGPLTTPPTKRPKRDSTIRRPKTDDGSDSSDGSDDENMNVILILDDLFKNNRNMNSRNNTKPEPEKEKVNDNKCPNPLCDHKNKKHDEVYTVAKITEVKDINDIIELGKTYHCKKNTHFNGMDLKILCRLVNPLSELKNMVGMKKVKENMVNQILFFLQGLNVKYEQDGFGKITSNTDMLHTVITGPPGVGKTELGKILGKVYKAMGVLSKGSFKLVTRSDLIAKYLGQTAVKTQDVINSCEGGVMFIDEAYALGHEEGRDSFSKECLDTLNQNLTEKRDFLCIIAGYKESLDKCFFSMNDGLKRRFTFRYDIEGYTGEELRQIFEVKLNADKWKVEFLDDAEKFKQYEEFFKKNKDNFPNYGGDIETLFLKCKIAHSKRIVFESDDKRRILNMDDIEKGFKTFIADRKGSGKKNLGLYD